MFCRLKSGLPTVMLAVYLSVANPCASQDCGALKLASATDAVNALDRGGVKTASCSRAAFQLIQNLPPEEAVPILIKHLGFGRPVANESNAHEDPYPAVDALAVVGPAAEPALIDFIARLEGNNSVLRRNALRALGLIRHGDVVPTIKLIRERSASLADTPAATSLDSAAQYLFKHYCVDGRMRICEKELQESTPEK
jgi:hypothetical protein